MSQQESNILNEVFMKPSNEIKTDRFSMQEAADCSGTCSSGICRTGIENS